MRYETPYRTNNESTPPRRTRDIPEIPLDIKEKKKKTRANLTIATLNMQGRGANSAFDPNNKWHHINQLMTENKLSILALQETHLDDELRSQINDLHH